VSDSYSFTFILKKDGPSTWVILAEKGHVLYELTRCSSPEDAMDRARAWASSWNSATVRFYDEKDAKRN